jgi:hypothetical protein
LIFLLAVMRRPRAPISGLRGSIQMSWLSPLHSVSRKFSPPSVETQNELSVTMVSFNHVSAASSERVRRWAKEVVAGPRS